MGLADRWLGWLVLPAYVAWVAAWAWQGGLARQRPRQPGATLRFPVVGALRGLPRPRALRLRPYVLGLRLVSVALLLVAVARPQSGRRQAHVWSQGVDIMLAIDTSGSMQALDLDVEQPIIRRRNRLQMVKDVVLRFVGRRDDDQLGLVVFGAEAFTQCPLTLDHGIVATLLEQVGIGMAGDRTAIGSGLMAAAKRLQRSAAKSKVIVLLTDGSNNAGPVTPRKAAEVARALRIKVYTVGAGGRGQAPFLVDTLFGKQVQYAAVDIDEAALKEIAEITGGIYFRAEDSKGLADVYDQIDRLEKSPIQNRSFSEYDERFVPFVATAVALLLLEMALLTTRLRKMP